MTSSPSAYGAGSPSTATSTTTAGDPPTIARSARVAMWSALGSGGALVVDTVTIAVVNHSFGVLDDALFLAGLAGLLLTVVALAAHLSAGRRGPARVASGVGWFVGLGLGLGALSFAMDRMGRHVFSDANVGLHGEWSFFSIGVALLVIAAWASRRG